MKKIITMTAAVLMLAVTVFAQEKNYKMIETEYIKPKNDKMKEFITAITNHSKKYHTTDPNKSGVWLVNTGPYTGWLSWVVGPCTFTQMDGRRVNEKEHTEDWMFNVMPYIDEVAEGEYWKIDDKVSYSPEGSFSGKEIWSIYDIKPFEGYRFTALLEKVVDVYKKKNYPNYMEVYRNQFESACGHDVAVAFGFKNWAFFDEEDNFWKDYEEVNGEGAKIKFFNEYRDIVVSAYDEVSEYIPDLSGRDMK
jgi:hemolysin-activating ACP:hemolysin acyltransferase